MLSHPQGKPTPEILEQAEHVDLPGLEALQPPQDFIPLAAAAAWVQPLHHAVVERGDADGENGEGGEQARDYERGDGEAPRASLSPAEAGLGETERVCVE